MSSELQERDGTSLETQEAACRRYADERGYVLLPQVFRDVFSGAILHERPQLTALRQEVRRGGLDVVVAFAVDRLSRNQAHLYIVAEELENASVRVEFVTESFEDSAVGKFLRSAKAFAAEVEREKFVERSVRGKRARVGSGKLLHGKTPLYGYDWPDDTKSRYVVNPVTAAVVRRMFDGSLSGKSLRAIAAMLTAESVPTPRGAQVWDPVVIRNVLRNPSYTGEAFAFRIKHTKVPGTNQSRHEERPPDEWVKLPDGTIPAIVDVAVFASVQARLRRNQVQAPRRLKDPEAYLLRGGYVRCGYCGNSMSAHTKRSRTFVSTAYECSRMSRASGLCSHHSITTKILDDAVWRRIEEVLTKPDVIARELGRLQQDDPSEAEATAVERALAAITRRKANLARSLGLFEDAEAAAPVVAQLHALRDQEVALGAELDRILGRRANWTAGQQRIADLEEWCRGIGAKLGTLNYEQRRTALDALGVQVRVWKSDHDPRFVITAGIPLDGALHTGQDSSLYAASQNIHS